MIFGRGHIGRALEKYEFVNDVAIFDPDLPKSNEVRKEVFGAERESLLSVMEQLGDQTRLVYFSTCSILDASEESSPYVRHKLEMERAVIERGRHFLIVRKPQVVGDINDESSALNYFFRSVLNDTEFVVWSRASRNLIDVHDLSVAVERIIDGHLFPNQTVNIAHPESISAPELVKQIEIFLGKRAQFRTLEKGSEFSIDTAVTSLFLPSMNRNPAYIQGLLRKYYDEARLTTRG